VIAPRDIGALAGQEMESRLADSVGGLRRGLAQVHIHFVLILRLRLHSCCQVPVAWLLQLVGRFASCITDRLKPAAAQARELQAALRGEAAQLETFIPVLIQGAASGISDALKQQVRMAECHRTLVICRDCSK
jgi:hypothetical protein